MATAGPPTVRTASRAPIGFAAPLLALATIGLGFALRLYRLGSQNIWWDEGWTVWLARMDPISIALRTAADTHPPLHYWLMHYWGSLAGTNAVAGRLLSVFFGILTIAVMYRLGRQAGGAHLGVLSALLLALERFHIWWSQDIKNYTLAGFFGLASLWFTLRLLDPAPRRESRAQRWLWAGYVAATVAAVYSHYLAWLLFLANNVFAAILLFVRWRRGLSAGRPFRRWVLAQVLVLGLFAPWLALYLKSATTWTAAPTLPFGLFLRLTGTLFALGETRDIEARVLLVAVLLALAGLGALHGLRRPLTSRPAQAALLGLVVVTLPPLTIYGLALTPAAVYAPQIAPRYLLIFLPGYVMLLALGLRALSRWPRLALTALVIVLAVQASSLAGYYHGRRWRDEYFSLANVINDYAQPGDGILLHTDQEWPVMLFYLRRPVPWDGVLAGEVLSRGAASSLARNMSGRFKRVWLVTIPDALAKDPQHLMDAELGRLLPRQYAQTFGDKQLTLFAQAPGPAADVPAENFWVQHKHPMDLSPDLKLLGYNLPLEDARSGDTVHVVTYWDVQAATSVQTELRSASGAAGATQAQAVPAGSRVRVQTDLKLAPDAEGEHSVFVVAGGRSAALGKLHVERPELPQVGEITNPLDYQLGEAIHLVGFDLPNRQVAPGARLPVTLFWSTTAPVERDYKVFVHLVGTKLNPDENNPLWGQVDRLPLEGALPMTAWAPGDVIRDFYLVPVDPDAPPGDYTLTVGLYDGLSGERLAVSSATGPIEGNEIPLSSVAVAP